jgi:rubrerythrin
MANAQYRKNEEEAEQRRVAAAPVPETVSCVICYENLRTHAFIPCGHLSICSVCNKSADGLHGKCPICNTQFAHIVRIYM